MNSSEGTYDCYPHTGNDGLSWRLSSSLSLSVSTQDETTDVADMPGERHTHASLVGIKEVDKEQMVLRGRHIRIGQHFLKPWWIACSFAQYSGQEKPFCLI